MITINIAKKLLRAFLRLIGLRSKCCDARLEYVFGYNYKDDGYRCTKCGARV